MTTSIIYRLEEGKEPYPVGIAIEMEETQSGKHNTKKPKHLIDEEYNEKSN